MYHMCNARVSSGFECESHALSGSSHSQGAVDIRWRHHSVFREVERSHQVMNVNERVEFGHFLRFNDVTADPHYPEKSKGDTGEGVILMQTHVSKVMHI